MVRGNKTQLQVSKRYLKSQQLLLFAFAKKNISMQCVLITFLAVFRLFHCIMFYNKKYMFMFFIVKCLHVLTQSVHNHVSNAHLK